MHQEPDLRSYRPVYSQEHSEDHELVSDNIWNLWCEQNEVVIEWMDSFCRGEMKHEVHP